MTVFTCPSDGKLLMLNVNVLLLAVRLCITLVVPAVTVTVSGGVATLSAVNTPVSECILVSVLQLPAVTERAVVQDWA